MANRERGEVEISLTDPKTRHTRKYNLKYGTNELCEIEQALGQSVQSFMTAKDFGINVLRECVYQGIKKYNRKLSVGLVGGMITQDNRQELYEAVGTAISIAYGVDPDEEQPEDGYEDPTLDPGTTDEGLIGDD